MFINLSTEEIDVIFNSLLNIFYDGIYISDVNGKTIKINERYEKLTGLKKEELLGRNVTDLVNDGVYNIALNPLVVKTGKSQASLQFTKVGRKVVINAHPIFDNNNKLVYVVTFVRDITVLSQLKNQIASQAELIQKHSQETKRLRQSMQKDIVIESPKMKQLIDLLKKIAATDATVLILGETGVGKDVFAKQIHDNSPRVNKPFFKVNCASIPENLIESELFGYESGAFSGASTKGKPGYFELADKGTLFLDEIGELPLAMQAKLLRVLEDQKVIRVGGTKVKKLDVRIIAATNRNLEEAIKENKFRSDLYYRLRIAVLNIPPLRERKEDILPLINHFLRMYNNKHRKNIAFSTKTLELLLRYKWPGNVREMKNLIQSLIVTQDKEVIEVSDLPPYITKKNKSIDTTIESGTVDVEDASLKDIMSEFEKNLLKDALNRYESISAIAKKFKVNRSTIFRKLKKYSLV